MTEGWEYSDDDLNVEDVYDNIASTWYSVGTYPSGDDIKEKTELPLTPNLRATVSAGDVTPAVQGEILEMIVETRFQGLLVILHKQLKTDND